MSDTQSIKLCEQCNENPEGEPTECPYLAAKMVSQLEDPEPCNCCDECFKECKLQS